MVMLVVILTVFGYADDDLDDEYDDGDDDAYAAGYYHYDDNGDDEYSDGDYGVDTNHGDAVDGYVEHDCEHGDSDDATCYAGDDYCYNDVGYEVYG